MKNIKIFLLTAVITAGIFSAVVFTACTKANCTGVVCQNGGACANGKCSCPTGFSGTFCQTAASTSLVYVNDTYTPISITVNGTAATIPVGGSYAFVGKFGTTATGTATTAASASSLGISGSGGTLGLTMNWAINNSFPASDTQRVPLDVGATWFFLRMRNTNNSLNVINYYVNVNFPYGQLYTDATVPNDGKTYDMGYYLAYSSSNTQVMFSNNIVKWYGLTLPFSTNQSVTVTVN